MSETTNTITAAAHRARYGKGPGAPTKAAYHGAGFVALDAHGMAAVDGRGWFPMVGAATRYATIEQAAAVAGVVEIIAL